MSQFETKLMTPEEHTGVFKTMAETIVQEDLDLDARVERGALHLDEHFPGWADKINLKNFRIASAQECVIGQMYGDYWDKTVNNIAKIYPDEKYEGSEWADDDKKLDAFAKSHGFYTDIYLDEQGREINDWDTLQESWVKAIKARQSG